jgi:uncharacterized protein
MPKLEMLRRRLGIEPPAASQGTTMTLTTASAQALVPTENASRYLQQLCKHWQHNLQVEFTPENGTVIFPKDVRGAEYPGDAVVTFNVAEAGLDVRIDASSAEQLEGLKGAVARHLDRFAFREAPLAFDWTA